MQRPKKTKNNGALWRIAARNLFIADEGQISPGRHFEQGVSARQADFLRKGPVLPQDEREPEPAQGQFALAWRKVRPSCRRPSAGQQGSVPHQKLIYLACWFSLQNVV
jgi:hypothetical protein